MYFDTINHLPFTEQKIMSLSTFLLIKTIICLALGIPFVLAPSAIMSGYGIALDPIATVMTRIVGAMFIGIGLLCLFTRKSTDAKTMQGITFGLFIGDTIGFIVVLLWQLRPAANPLEWVEVALWLFLAAGLGYFRFLKPGAS